MEEVLAVWLLLYAKAAVAAVRALARPIPAGDFVFRAASSQ